MRTFLSMVRQDIKLYHRNGFFAVVLSLALLFILLINFAVPSEVKVDTKEYVVDLTDEGHIAATLQRAGFNPQFLLQSEQELQRIVTEKDSIGIVFRGSATSPQATIYHQGNEPEKALRSLGPAVSRLWNSVVSDAPTASYVNVYLRPETPKPPFNKSLVPVLLTIEPVMLGFILVAVIVFQEKSERTLRALRVSPLSSWAYLFSKIIASLVMALVYAIPMLIFTLGINVDYPRALLILFLATYLMTAMGLLASIFFRDLSSFIAPALAVFALASLPMTSYFFPAFKLAIFDYMPTYSILFGLREVLFPTGNASFFWPVVLSLLAQGAVVTLLCKWAIEKRLMKEAG